MADPSRRPEAVARNPSVRWHAPSVFLSAFLLFLVQPMVARMLLPRYGGSPAVWTTALVFFQAALLAGYAYAHGAARLSPRRQAALHALLVVLAALALPPRLPAAGSPAEGGWPGLAVLAALAGMVGAPFVVLAANSSLVQLWRARAGGGDPYPLYAASNAGSLLGLAAYPFVVEPLLGVRAQAWLLAAGYGAFALVTLRLLADAARRGPRTTGGAAPSGGVPRGLWGPRAPVEDASPGRAVLWVARAAVASALLVATSLAITTDVAAMPLFWVVPLALYLSTFIAAFGAPRPIPRRLVAAAAVGATCAALVANALPLDMLTTVLVPPLLALGLGALLCHGDLAAERPPAEHLTAFYLWIAAGGALGGALCSLVAPLVFDRVAEYPLSLVALAFLVAVPPGLRPSWPRGLSRAAIVQTLPMVALALVGGWRLAQGGPDERVVWLAGAPLLLLAAGAALSNRPGRFGLATALVVALHAAGLGASERIVAEARSFFGVMRVRETPTERILLHGTTMHGAQRLDSGAQGLRRPAGYFHPDGPLGSHLADLGPGARIGIVGLGTGALAAVATEGQHVVFYEIDPLVERLARAHFGFLAASPAEVEVVIGDGRLRLAAEPDAAFDLIVIDAFSSDAVPVHLLTAEALDLYQRKVVPDGLVVLHISNRHLDLARVLRGHAAQRGARVAHAFWEPPADALAEGAARTQAAALSPSPDRLARVLEQPGWAPLGDGPTVRWTDDRSSVFGVLKW